ncbi:branched-chain amino acid transport system II carrier protein [Paraferrimonas sedimenticola]|uniref:Branched-chain amino acid transport system carrier protein n=1 Tax=Paraferrimonas sedimenticola TaxID=375674 RepID=A0AA37RUH5_9GAMM|nr:branched-chain amino acid transport system II carrier protein [Paraferrimonas sedimenticola]GLP95551.1 branched-chain amino acid transport system carrier protein [Paraferrimonas sedimenticola]
MQQNQLSLADTLGLGFMTFAFFLGAGNLIFPPLAGLMSGEAMPMAMMGFMLTAVGLPLLTLFAVAKGNGTIMSLLPPVVAITVTAAIFIIIGPAFAAPRTSLVAYEIGYKPFFADANATSQALYTGAFFVVAMVLSLYPGRLLDTVGKILTPVMIILLMILSTSVMFYDGADALPASGNFAEGAFVAGVLEGYNTMDALASVVFGALIIDVLRKKQITDLNQQNRYLVIAAVIAAIGLAGVYLPLFVLGSQAAELAPNAENGGQILSAYVSSAFGGPGLVMLAAVVTLACLTTAVGLISACSDFFSETFKRLEYKPLVVLFSVVCAVIANVGLTQLIAISVPILVSVYPVAVALVIVTLLRDRFADPVTAHRVVFAFALCYGLIDGMKAAGLDMSFVQRLSDVSMGWVIPTAIVVFVFTLLKQKPQS